MFTWMHIWILMDTLIMQRGYCPVTATCKICAFSPLSQATYISQRLQSIALETPGALQRLAG